MPWLLVAGLFMLLRRLERWLHQHIFKVGWLLTKSYSTTTILYYAFFLPGVFLYEFSYWLMAGILNVRAERALQMPQKQEIAELNLNFVKLPKNTPPFKLAVITATPLVVGLIVIWLIAIHVLDITGFVSQVGSGGLDDLAAALGALTTAPDFWLWIYLVFTISNTMIPNLKDLRGGRVIFTVLVVVTLFLLVLGLGNQVVLRILTGPVVDALYLIASIFIIIIAINLFTTLVLGTIESIIERVTGDSATFEKGKLVAITRRELLEQRRKQAARALPSGRQQTKAATGAPSIYNLPLPIPGTPDVESVTPDTILIEPEEKPARPSLFDERHKPPAVISAAAAEKQEPATPVEKPEEGEIRVPEPDEGIAYRDADEASESP